MVYKHDQIFKKDKNKLLLIGIVVAYALTLAMSMVIGASAVKPTEKKNGAEKYGWFLSADVMPVPPYGSADVEGSDVASKLIVNHPNGKVKAAVTGVMNDLLPNTTYQVFISNGYTPYTPAEVVGEYVWTVLGTYVHDISITEQYADGTFVGTGCYPTGSFPNCTYTEVITGQVMGNQFTMTTVYNNGYTATATGAIASDGTVSGSSPWTWSFTEGTVTPQSGSTGWSGLLSGTVPAFTFVTDQYGSGSWHVNLREGDIGEKEAFSVWINGGGRTLLISETVEL